MRLQEHALANAAAILFGLLALCLSGVPARLGAAGSVVAELLVLIAGTTLALGAARPWLDAASNRVPLRLAVGLVVAMALGQIARSKKAFPLMPYTMYTRAAEDDATFYEYQAVRRSGIRERFRPSLVIATLGRARIVKGLAREFDAVAELEASGGDASQPLARASALLRALIARRNAEHTGDPIAQVEVVHVRLPPPYDPGLAQRRTVKVIAAGAAP